ncbi:MAG: AlpA family phage regulatory protein [Sphingomonadales bacterium]|nr:MAG: AlpA family phage regulatory protein [Sphingomonadales bacterium]
MATPPTPDQIAAASARLRSEGMVGLRDLTIICAKSEPTIRREIRRGEFPSPVRVSPGRIAWPAGAIRDWLASRQPQRPAQAHDLHALGAAS